MARYTWNHIFHQKNKKGGYVSAIIDDDNTITDLIEIAENFNNFFTLCSRPVGGSKVDLAFHPP